MPSGKLLLLLLQHSPFPLMALAPVPAKKRPRSEAQGVPGGCQPRQEHVAALPASPGGSCWMPHGSRDMARGFMVPACFPLPAKPTACHAGHTPTEPQLRSFTDPPLRPSLANPGLEKTSECPVRPNLDRAHQGPSCLPAALALRGAAPAHPSHNSSPRARSALPAHAWRQLPHAASAAPLPAPPHPGDPPRPRSPDSVTNPAGGSA